MPSRKIAAGIPGLLLFHSPLYMVSEPLFQELRYSLFDLVLYASALRALAAYHLRH